MKKILASLARMYCSPYRWYRKKMGGRWFFVVDKDVSGIAAPSTYWTQYPQDDETILKEEHY